MGLLISLLNKNGIKTYMSCEGHDITDDGLDTVPYIRFKDIKDKDKFDMKDIRLRYWKIRENDLVNSNSPWGSAYKT